MRKQRSLRLAAVSSAELAVQYSLWYVQYQLANWRAKFNTLTRIYDVSNLQIYVPKLPRNYAHSLTHRLAKLLYILSMFRIFLKKIYSVLTHWGWGHLNCLNARYRGF